MAQGAFKLQGGGSEEQGAYPNKSTTTEVTAHVTTTHSACSLCKDRPTAHWVGPETLVSLVALADSGSQVNTVMPSFVHQHEFPVQPLGDLVDYPLNWIGLGGTRTRLMGFMILQVQVSEIAGYDEDVILLVVADESDFSRHMPLVVGTCTLGRIINVIKESKIDRLSTPLAIARTSSLLSRHGMAVLSTDGMDGALAEGGAMVSEDSADQEINEPVLMRESMKLGPFQIEILEGKTKPLLGESAHMMVMPLKAGEAQWSGAWPLPPGLHVLHMYEVKDG